MTVATLEQVGAASAAVFAGAYLLLWLIIHIVHLDRRTRSLERKADQLIMTVNDVLEQIAQATTDINAQVKATGAAITQAIQAGEDVTPISTAVADLRNSTIAGLQGITPSVAAAPGADQNSTGQ